MIYLGSALMMWEAGNGAERAATRAGGKRNAKNFSGRR